VALKSTDSLLLVIVSATSLLNAVLPPVGDEPAMKIIVFAEAIETIIKEKINDKNNRNIK
jgi:hypothetical protein